jgi:uncharacterized protein (TIGR02996 family)
VEQPDAFLKAILADPDDDAPRLAYADWLDEAGDSDRAEFIRVQIALANLPRDDPQRPPLIERERQLLLEHAPDWAANLPRPLHSWTFRRGFVEAIELTAATFLSRAENFLRLAPIRSIKLTDAGSVMHRLSACPSLERIVDLDLSASYVWPSRLALLLSSPYLTCLESLTLDSNGMGHSGIRALMRAPVIASLTRLSLRDNRLYNAGALRLASSSHLPGLRFLNLRSNGIGIAGVQAIAGCPHLTGLARLDFRDNYAGDEGTRALRDRFGDRVRL